MLGEKIDALVLFGNDNRFYYTKINSSFGCVVVTDTSKIFITDTRYDFYARQQLKGWRVVCVNLDKFYETLKQELKQLNVKYIGFEEDVLTFSQHRQLKLHLDDYTLKPAGTLLKHLRAVKSPEQIIFIEEAQKAAEKALKKIEGMIKAGITEKELSAEIMYEMMRAGADALAFDSIVAFGENAAKPHHFPTYRKLEKDDVVLIDIGAKLNGYCGDMTRTFGISEVPKRLEQAHGYVLEALDYTVKNIRAGMTGHEADAFAREVLRSGGFEKEFCHSTGHGVGISVHEYPRLGVGSDDILKENMVVTVEPGVYIEGFGGVRIEDLVVIGENSSRVITSYDRKLYV